MGHIAGWQCRLDKRAIAVIDTHDIDGARKVVRGLSQRGLQWHRGAQSVAWRQVYGAVKDSFFIFDRWEAAEAAFMNSVGGGANVIGEIDGPFILLAPPSSNRHVVCLLGGAWRVTMQECQISLYLNLFGLSNQPNQIAWHRGYRLEAAHSSGVHNYPHVQPIRALGRISKKPIAFADQSVPDTFPAFPMRGYNLTTICAAVAVSLEGKSALGDLFRWLRGNKYQREITTLVR